MVKREQQSLQDNRCILIIFLRRPNEILETCLAERAVSIDMSPEISDGAILEKLTNSTKFELVVHFSLHPLNIAVPKDFTDDFKNKKDLDINQFQLRKLRGESKDLFQENIDLKVFPNLFQIVKWHT